MPKIPEVRELADLSMYDTLEVQRLKMVKRELIDVCDGLRQRVGELEVLLDRANQERDMLKERLQELEEWLKHTDGGLPR